MVVACHQHPAQFVGDGLHFPSPAVQRAGHGVPKQQHASPGPRPRFIRGPGTGVSGRMSNVAAAAEGTPAGGSTTAEAG